MEMKDGFELDGPFLAIGRQSKGLGFEDFECGASSSHWPVSDHSGNNVCAKKSRIDDGEIWHTDENASGSFCGEFSHAQALPGSQRTQQVNPAEIIQGQWNAVSCNANNINESSSGLSMACMENDANLGQSSRSGLLGYCELTGPGLTATGFDFLRTGADAAGNGSSASVLSGWVAGNGSNEVSFSAGSASMDDKVGNWSGLVGLHGTEVPDTSSSMSCFADVSGFEGKSGRDLLVNLVQPSGNMTEKHMTMDHQNTILHAPLNRTIGDSNGASVVENIYFRAGVGDGVCLDSNISYSLSSSDTDTGKAVFQIGNLESSSIDHSDSKMLYRGTGGRRSSCKRKLSTPVIADASYFQASQLSTRRASNARTGGVSGSSKTNANALSCASIPNVLLPTGASSMVQMQDDHHRSSSGFLGNESDLYEALRGSAGKHSSLAGSSGGNQRMVRNRPVSSHQEESRSQLHSLFARNLRRSIPAAQSQALFSRGLPVEQSGDTTLNGANNIRALPESDHLAPAFGQGSSSSSSVPGFSGKNPSPNSNALPASLAPVRERISGMLEGSRIRRMSSRSSSWAGTATLEGRSTNLTSAGAGVSSSMPLRAMTPLEAIAQSSQAANSVLYQNMDSSSPMPALLSNSHNSAGLGRNRHPSALPPMATQNPSAFESSVEIIPTSAGMYAGPSSTAFRSSLFMDGQGGVLAAPVHSIFGMPLRGFHMLNADRENRQRFVSEILSALEHARRNEDLTFEELVMLDPSLIYGGIDIHDQHSDMRLDVDNMSYEELLALEERIGNVSTGLTDETISKCLRESKYSSLDAAVAVISQESDLKCSICQEEYFEEDELATLDCGHAYHTVCIKQWLLLKNQCPVCKCAAYTNS